MNPRTKLIVALSILLVAALIYVLTANPFKPAPGSKAEMIVDCDACKFNTSMKLSTVIANGGMFSGETGWTLKCPNCGKVATVRSPGMPKDPNLAATKP